MNNDFFWIGGKHAVLEAIKNKKRKYSKIFTTNENKKNLVNQTNSVHIKKILKLIDYLRIVVLLIKVMQRLLKKFLLAN